MRYVAVLLAAVLLAVPLSAVNPKKDKQETLADFVGSIERITKKEVVIRTDAGNEMTFIRTKRTTFISAGRQLSGAAMPQGIGVKVEAFERPTRELEAVTVTVVVPDQSPSR